MSAGSLFRTRARVAQEYNAAWKVAQQREDEAIAAARALFRVRVAAIQARYDEEYPVVCTRCEGSDRPECDGCELFTGVKS